MRKTIACAAALGALLFPGAFGSHGSHGRGGEAQAAVAVAYTLEQLVAESPLALFAEAAEQKSEWAFVAGSKRIVTYTRLQPVESIYGPAVGELWVRTLGGVVGRIGQQVSGEAAFMRGERAVVFLTRSTDDAWVVTGMGQGHYPLRARADDSTDLRLAPSPLVGTLLDRSRKRRTAQSALVGLPLRDALSAIRAAKGGPDGAPR